MDDLIKKLLDRNKEWAQQKSEKDPAFFEQLAKGQQPDYLWIGCADSRVPANQVTGSEPGDLFVHRNIANLAISSDVNLMSVLYYAVHALKVPHIIVCGHYGCGGVGAALQQKDVSIINHWLQPIKEVYAAHKQEVDNAGEQADQVNKLVELNVAAQVQNLAKTNIVQQAWKERNLTVHGLVFDLASGELKDLGCSARSVEDVDNIFRFNS